MSSTDLPPTAKPVKHKRKKKLINPRMQLKIAGAAVAIALVSVLVLTVMLNEAFVEMVDRGWIDPANVSGSWLEVLIPTVFMSLAILFPLVLSLGILLSHRIAGPMYRFRVWLADVRDGKETRPCKIREGDEHQDFCELLNEVTEPLRDGTVVRKTTEGDEPEAAPAPEAEAA